MSQSDFTPHTNTHCHTPPRGLGGKSNPGYYSPLWARIPPFLIPSYGGSEKATAVRFVLWQHCGRHCPIPCSLFHCFTTSLFYQWQHWTTLPHSLFTVSLFYCFIVLSVAALWTTLSHWSWSGNVYVVGPPSKPPT